MEAFSNEAADDSRELMDQLAVENRERYDYRKFLQKFSVLKETVQIDPMRSTMYSTIMACSYTEICR